MTDPRSPGEVETTIVEWPSQPRKIAEDMIETYGPPDEASDDRLVWHGNGPWKRTEVTREGDPHEFPKPHTDHLEQVVDYQVPVERADEVTAFDGSVAFDRTRGELSARCDSEAMNTLTLNLAHEVASGEMTVDEARHDHALAAMKENMGASPELTEELHFDTTGHRGDPDVEIVSEVTGARLHGRSEEHAEGPT